MVLLAVLVPFFPGVFLRGEVLVPAKFMYELPPWSAHSPPDLPYQNPPSTEVTLAVAVWYRLTDLYFDRGELPLWNSYEYTGAPLIGNMQSAIFYPPRLLFRLAGDTYVGMTIYIVFRFWLCGFNAFLAGRLLGLRLPFANLYSILFMVAGYNQFWTFYPPPDVMAWLPLVFAGSEVALNGRYRLGAGLLMISVAMGVLAAHPSTFLLGCIGIGLYALARLIAMRGPVRHVVWCAVSAGGAFCVSMGICAIQVLPFAEYLPHTARLTALTGSRLLESFSYSGYDLLCLWGPRMCGTEYSKNFWEDTNLTYGGMLYLGMTTWVCLSLLTKWSALDQGLRRRIGALLGVSALCFYGASAFPGAALVHELPVISGSRPAYFLAFPTVAVPLCAVFAVQAWVGGGAAPRDLVRPAILAVAIAVIVGAAVVSAQYLSPGYIEVMGTGVDLNSFMMKQCAIAAAFTVAGFLIVLWCALDSKRAKWPVVALCLLAVADQAVALWDLMPSNPRKYVAPNTQITDFLQAQPQPCRVRFDPASNRAGYQVLYGIEAYDGYDAIFPMRFKRFYDALDRRTGG
ncbi:MAG: YfhO family protein, partial [Candidatus Hydrogenedentes bacterium]|nr:YfhO family protein [Candidatus Hydrogenedentota bacterium]